MSLATGETIHWRAHYTSDGVSKTDLGDGVLIYVRDKDGTLVKNGLVCTHIGDGTYEFKDTNPTAGQYSAVFKTADTTVDQREIAAKEYVGQGGVDYLDASVAGIPASVWLNTIRDLTTPLTDEASPKDMAATGGGFVLQMDYGSIAGVSKIFLVKDDRKPYISCTLKDANGDPIDISTYTIQFKMRKVGATTLKVDGTCDKTDAGAGKCEYRWKAGDLDTAGDYKAEFEFTDVEGLPQTWPPGGPIPIHIRDDLDPNA